MNRHVNAIAGRMSLRPPQRESLDILSRITEIAPPQKGGDLGLALAAIRAEFPAVSDFEREFPSLCFALATGVGKTRLMGAFIAYLYLEHGVKNFFVLAPNLTIYDKLITDFKPNTPKYVFKGFSEPMSSPVITHGENYERPLGDLFPVRINIFNISKINSEVRGGKAPRIRSFREEIGESYFDYLAGLPDLVLIMDESHRYRASAGVRAINELKPVLGLELTATPFVEGAKGPVPFKNVIYDYPLARAMEDGFVKEPAVVTRENFVSAGKSAETLQEIKLQDGIRLHESVKVDLETYARQTGKDIVKPFMLVIARDTTHAAELMKLIKDKGFFGGRYAEKVIQVDSSTKEEEIVRRLLRVEHADEPTEIVIHVNMLKEGWDVTNLYTIVPLRAANARTLIEQSIGRGLRLPYGHRTGVPAVDRLNIVAHDRFQEIVDEARRPGSVIRLQQLVLKDGDLEQRKQTVVARPNIEAAISPAADAGPKFAGMQETAAVFSHEEQPLAKLAYDAIRKLESRPDRLPNVAALSRSDIQAALVEEVKRQAQPAQLQFEGVVKAPDIAAVVAKTAELVAKQTINIPRILVVPKGPVQAGFRPFRLDLRNMNYEVPSEVLLAQHLRTGQVDRMGARVASSDERRLEDFIVSDLIDYPDIAYDQQAELLYELSDQVVAHLRARHPEDGVRSIFQVHRKAIAAAVHAQMQAHYSAEGDVDHEVKVSRGFTTLKESAFSSAEGEAALDFRLSPPDKSNMARYVFGGFRRCLYPLQKFQSEAERKLAIILDREAQKWFKPARGQFQLYYRRGSEEVEYQPDFVAETDRRIFMLEPKASNEMDDPEVIAKKSVAEKWCAHASDYAASHADKPWKYALIPHSKISENMTIEGLIKDA